VNSKSSEQYDDTGADGAESLGRLLRGAREARGLSLRELSDQTRISRRYLEAIEAEDFKQLPGGIFNRSFVKAYARAVGVPEERAVDLYNRALRERGEGTDDAPTRQQSRIYTDDAPARPPLLTAVLSLVILGIISLGIYALLHFYNKRNADAGAQQQQQQAGAPQQAAANQGGLPAPAGQSAAAADAAPAPTASAPAARTCGSARAWTTATRPTGFSRWTRSRTSPPRAASSCATRRSKRPRSN
jgi:cytoskeleton protein RodZ